MSHWQKGLSKSFSPRLEKNDQIIGSKNKYFFRRPVLWYWKQMNLLKGSLNIYQGRMWYCNQVCSARTRTSVWHICHIFPTLTKINRADWSNFFPYIYQMFRDSIPSVSPLPYWIYVQGHVEHASSLSHKTIWFATIHFKMRQSIYTNVPGFKLNAKPINKLGSFHGKNRAGKSGHRPADGSS